MSLKNKNPFVNMRLQKVTVGILCLVLVGLASCVKQKNCEGGIVGTFQYLEEPIHIKPYCQFKEKKITSVFWADSYNNRGSWEQYITGNIPTRYMSGDSIRVRICLKNIHEGDAMTLAVQCDDYYGVYKLTCIEKED